MSNEVTFVKIIDYGNAMLSFSSFMRTGKCWEEVRDIVLSTVIRLTATGFNGLNLENRLAECVGKKSFEELNQGN